METLHATLRHDAGRQWIYDEVPCEAKPGPRSGNTQSGYGSRIPTDYIVKYLGRWHRVYCRIFSNIGTTYIRSRGEQILVDIERR
jgi:hypothetical protein